MIYLLLALMFLLVGPVSAASINGGGSGGLASTDLDTCAEMAALWTDETGTCGGPVLSQGPTIDSPVITTKMNRPSATAFPGSPSVGDVVIITDDSVTNACDSAAGTAVSECRWNGTSWVAIGNGSGPTILTMIETTAPAAPSTATHYKLYYDSATDRLGTIEQGGSAKDYVTAADTQTLTNKTITSGVFATKMNFPRVTAFPGTPAAGDVVIVTDDSTAGACDSAAGTVTSLCQYDGAAWVKLGDGTAAGGALSSADIDTSVELRTIVTDESGTGALLFAGGDIAAGTATTPAANDNDTSIATTAYVQTELTAYASDTATLTNKTVDCTTAGNVCTVYKYLSLPLVGVSAGTAGHVWNDDPLSTTCTAASTAGTNQTRAFCTFPDSDGEIGKQLVVPLPTGYVAGSLAFRVTWKTTGTGNLRPRLQTLCYASDAAADAAYSNSTYITAAAGTSARWNKTAWTTATDTGCDAEEDMAIRFSRNRTEASDTLNAAADVEQVEIRYAMAQ